MYAVSGARQQPLYEARSQAQIDQEKLDATIRTYVTTETPSDKTAFVRLVNRLVNNRGSYLIEPKDAGPDNFAEKLAKVKPFDREDVVSTFEDLTKPYDFRWWSSKDLGSIIAIIQEMTKEECKHFFDVAKSLFQTYPRVLNRSFATVQNLSQADADDWADIAFKYMYLISIPILNECPEIIPIIAKILKENRGKFISILESFALDRSAIHKIVAIAEALSKTPFEQWDDILEKVAALAPRTQNSPDVHLCIDAIGQVDPDLREATVKQVLRLESLRDGSDVAQIIQMLDRFDIQYRDRIVETALLLVPDRSPKKLICLMANTPKEIDELSQCALQIKENCYQIGDIEWLYKFLTDIKDRKTFTDLAISLIDDEMSVSSAESILAELKSVQPANRRESIVALVKALLVYSPNKNKLEWIIFELRCVDPELLPKIMSKLLLSLHKPITCLEIANLIRKSHV